MAIVEGFLVHSVTWEARTSEDDFGDPDFAAPVTIPARVDEHSVLVNPAGSRERAQETTVMVGPEHDVQIGDRISGEVGGRAFSGYVSGRTAITLVNGKLDGYTLQL